MRLRTLMIIIEIIVAVTLTSALIYKYTEDKNKPLNREVAKLQEAVQSQKEEIKTLTQNLKKAKKESETLKRKIKGYQSKSLIFFNQDDLKDFFMSHYDYISPIQKEKIFKAIIKYGTMYDINPLILFSVFHTESKFKFWITHPSVVVKVPIDASYKKFKKVKTSAIGLGGVIWEIWRYRLQNAGIAKTKSDLYDPEINVHATAYILNYYRKQPQLKNTRSPIESALLRYYGLNGTKTYFQKIDSFIGTLIRSDLYSE